MSKLFPNLIPAGLKADALNAFLQLEFVRPGRVRLRPDGFEEFGPSIAQIAGCVQPLIFDSALENYEYGIAGSCFLVHYRGRLFVITAKHCLTAHDGNNLRIALNSRTKSFLPLKYAHRGQSDPPDQDFADLAIFETAPELLEIEEQKEISSLNLDPLRVPNLQIKHDAKLVVPGFPACLNDVDYDRFVIHIQKYIPSGNYRGGAGRHGIHRMEFDELEQITWPTGMSGSPVYFVENHPESHFFGFMGMLIKAHQYLRDAEFIGANIIFAGLDKIIDEK